MKLKADRQDTQGTLPALNATKPLLCKMWKAPYKACKKAVAYTCAISTSLALASVLYTVHPVSHANSSEDDTSVTITQQNSLVYPALKWFAPYPVGVLVNSDKVLSEAHSKTLNHGFDQITAGWDIRMETLSEGPGQYNWGGADTLVQFSQQNNLSIHGQSLIWHGAIPEWLQNFPGTDTDFEAAVKTYITDVVSRYQGKLKSWDVINEVFDEQGNMIDNVFLQRMGSDYVAKIFQFAHEADPTAKLFYNDFMGANKNPAILNLVDDLLSRQIPIHGIGIQMHIIPQIWDNDLSNFTFVEAFFDQLAARNLLVHLSELDVIMNWGGSKTSLTPEDEFVQKNWYKAAVTAFNHLPAENQYALTLWSLSDRDNWVTWEYKWQDWPAVMDETLEPKGAYYGVLEALIGDYGWPEHNNQVTPQ